MSKEKRLQDIYKEIKGDNFPDTMTVTFGDQTIEYQKVGWEIDGENKGLRYGENPGQEAALYRPVNGNLVLGEVQTIQPERFLASKHDLLQSGKHPGKTNITDADNALNILRYFSDEPVVAIMKHNNPCGVAIGENLTDAYIKANNADIVAAFGGTIALNMPVDLETAKAITKSYAEVIVAPEYEEGVMKVFGEKKNLRVMKISNMSKLEEWVGAKVIDFKSLIDGGVIAQTSFVPEARTIDDIRALPLGYFIKKGPPEELVAEVKRKPTEREYRDMWFGWLVESGITSNSVIYVKDGVTVGIGTGEQDRVGVAKIARDKAYEKLADTISRDLHNKPLNILVHWAEKESSQKERPTRRKIVREVYEMAAKQNGGLEGAVMVSDAFFPYKDGVYVGLDVGVSAIIQPGGSMNDAEVIDAVNKANATMVFTGQRSFKH
ncbi:IMP cyclohydrolase [Candidatus Woesearchaeota archaeon]|nr:IMP cyclohydrolase [Candidatus Woesearchaeota archaeon]